MNEAEFSKLAQSVRQAGRIKGGLLKATRITNISPADVRKIRSRLKKSQSEFALMIGVSVATLQNWEQGRRRPEGPARALLRIAEQNPKAVAEALGA